MKFLALLPVVALMLCSGCILVNTKSDCSCGKAEVTCCTEEVWCCEAETADVIIPGCCDTKPAGMNPQACNPTCGAKQ